LFRRRGFRDLYVGQAVSALGDWTVTIALMALVLDLTRSSTAVAGILVLRLAPTAIAGPLATRLVSRWDQKQTMLAVDLARAGVVALVPWVRALWWVYLWAFVLEVGGLVFLPARDSAVPSLAGDDELETANGLLLGTSYGLIPVGAAAFALMSALLPGGRSARLPMIVVFTFDAVTFLVSYAMLTRLPELGGANRSPDEDEDAPKRPFLHALGLPMVRALVVPAALAATGIGSLFSLGIVFVRDVLGASTAQFALLVALFGVGALVGLFVLRTTRWRGVGVARAAVVAQQESLEGSDRVGAFAVFHVVLRAALALAAIASGVAADLLDNVDWPGFGHVAPARIVLLVSGVVVVVSMAFVHIGRGWRSTSRSGATDAAPVATSCG
jgi:MFS family permease